MIGKLDLVYIPCQVTLLNSFNDLMLVNKTYSSRVRSEQSLVRWATPQLHDIDALSKMVDPALNGMYPAKSLSRFADIIALCVQVSFYLCDLSFGA